MMSGMEKERRKEKVAVKVNRREVKVKQPRREQNVNVLPLRKQLHLNTSSNHPLSTERPVKLSLLVASPWTSPSSYRPRT